MCLNISAGPTNQRGRNARAVLSMRKVWWRVPQFFTKPLTSIEQAEDCQSRHLCVPGSPGTRGPLYPGLWEAETGCSLQRRRVKVGGRHFAPGSSEITALIHPYRAVRIDTRTRGTCFRSLTSRLMAYLSVTRRVLNAIQAEKVITKSRVEP